jgi:para-aminobenzoate synthetase component 1
MIETTTKDGGDALKVLDKHLSGENPAIFTLSYDFGMKLQGIPRHSTPAELREPDTFIALFDTLIFHDYDRGTTFLAGREPNRHEISALLAESKASKRDFDAPNDKPKQFVTSNFSRAEYISAVEQIRDQIRLGNTYQTILTQQLRCASPPALTPEQVFWRLRRDHPAPFAAFLRRKDSTVISASPERFFRVGRDGSIETSPIKGTRPRGKTPAEDAEMRTELSSSEKDRAENTMIVDLMRNDLGRVCEYGSVKVEKLCEIEEHPTLMHLVSTVRGQLRGNVRISDILRALFPCGSITGAPKIKTMQIIEELEIQDRGLSMGAIGCYLPRGYEDISDVKLDASVAIRTMVSRGNDIVFNVGGGVVIDSDPEKEYQESLLKAKALLEAIGANADLVLNP